MKISEGDINYNAVSLIKDLVESRYGMIMEATAEERGYLLWKNISEKYNVDLWIRW